jgi:glutathione peroxidase-family protein
MQLLLKITLCLGAALLSTGIYSIHFSTISGNDKSMQDYNGKTIMVVVLPTNTNRADTLLLKSIDSISRAYSEKLSVIAAISLDDGFYAGNAQYLKNFYSSFLNAQVTITSPMHTRKGAEQKQHELFSWLTHKQKNTHFDLDVSGTGQSFFINDHGQLYAVINPETKLTQRIIKKILY